MAQIKKDLRRFSMPCCVVKPPFCKFPVPLGLVSCSSIPHPAALISIMDPDESKILAIFLNEVASVHQNDSFHFIIMCTTFTSPSLLSHTHTQKKTLLAVKNKKIFTFLITETVILVDGCKFSEKDCLYFTFIWVHDRQDRRGGIRDG